MLRKPKYDFVTIRSLVDAAQSAQDAGEDTLAEALCDKLADGITKHKPEKANGTV